jgi:Fe-S cluster assembly iron-binding protein IscA
MFPRHRCGYLDLSPTWMEKQMLEISSEAATAIKRILAAADVPAGAAFRLSAEPSAGPDEEGGFAVTVMESPPPEDQVVVAGDVAICVEPSTAELLDDKQLDAWLDDGKFQFSLSDQAA